jgi:hypothetical protein
VWSTDSNGNFTSNLLSNVYGTNASLKAIETVLHQDLNGDGVINASSTVLEISGSVPLKLVNLTQAATIDAGATLELTGAVSGSITFNSSTGTLVLDQASKFVGTLIHLTGDGTAANSNQIDLKDIAYSTGASVSYSGNTSGGVLTVVDAQNHSAHISLVGDYTHSMFNLSNDGNGGTLVIDPPKDGFYFASVPTPQTVPAVQGAGAARLGSDGFIFDQINSAETKAFSIEAFNDLGAQMAPVADSIRSALDLGTLHSEPVHFAMPLDAHFADLHNFLLHA